MTTVATTANPITVTTATAELTQAVVELERIMQAELGKADEDLNGNDLEMWAEQAELVSEELRDRAIASDDFVVASDLWEAQSDAEDVASILDDLFWRVDG